MSRKELLETILGRQLEWIRAADSKIAPMLAVATTMLGVLAALAPSPTDWSVISIVFGILAGILLIACLICLFLATVPRTEGPDDSLIYFEGIKQRAAEEYRRDILTVSDDGYLEDLVRQCHRNAEIAGSKFGLVRLSMLFLFLSLAPWLSTVYILYKLSS